MNVRKTLTVAAITGVFATAPLTLSNATAFADDLPLDPNEPAAPVDPAAGNSGVEWREFPGGLVAGRHDVDMGIVEQGRAVAESIVGDEVRDVFEVADLIAVESPGFQLVAGDADRFPNVAGWVDRVGVADELLEQADRLVLVDLVQHRMVVAHGSSLLARADIRWAV